MYVDIYFKYKFAVPILLVYYQYSWTWSVLTKQFRILKGLNRSDIKLGPTNSYNMVHNQMRN